MFIELLLQNIHFVSYTMHIEEIKYPNQLQNSEFHKI